MLCNCANLKQQTNSNNRAIVKQPLSFFARNWHFLAVHNGKLILDHEKLRTLENTAGSFAVLAKTGAHSSMFSFFRQCLESRETLYRAYPSNWRHKKLCKVRSFAQPLYHLTLNYIDFLVMVARTGRFSRACELDHGSIPRRVYNLAE